MPQLSKRSTRASWPMPEYFAKAMATFSDLYSESNPNGYISLAVAQNNISSPMIASALSRLPPMPVENLTYTEMAADPPCAEVMASFMSQYITKRSIDPDQLVFSCGASSALDMLIFSFCDPGDAIMIVGPGYRGFENDAMARAGVRTVIAKLDEENGFRVSAEVFERGWKEAGGENSRIRCVIVCSPGNPTGEVLSPSAIRGIVAWARERRMHAVFDELYALSTYGEDKFYSVAEVLDNKLGDDIHIVWSLSKDLSASGLRFGVVLSHSNDILKCLSRISFFSNVSRMTQWAVQNLLSDDVFIKTYLEENRSRLAASYKEITALLAADNVPFVPAQAGFFIWVNLGKWMKGSPSRDSEMDLWEKILNCKVILSPGCECFSTSYGWFRLCFATVSTKELVLAWTRIRKDVLVQFLLKWKGR